MNIQEAAKQAAVINGKMKLRLHRLTILITPTNTADCCYLEVIGRNKPAARRWNPRLIDLLSDDWEVVHQDGSGRWEDKADSESFRDFSKDSK